jgi:hypothetical protein
MATMQFQVADVLEPAPGVYRVISTLGTVLEVSIKSEQGLTAASLKSGDWIYVKSAVELTVDSWALLDGKGLWYVDS